MPAHFNILTLNVRGLGLSHKHDLILNELEKLRFDFVSLALRKRARSSANGKEKFIGHLVLPTLPAWQFYVHLNFSGGITRFTHDTEGRILSALALVHSTTFNLVNIYAPNDSSVRKVFFDSLHTYFLSQNNQIIGGDFNCIESELHRLEPGADFAADRRTMSAFRADLHLIDVWRKANPKGRSYTWANKDLSQASRIDKFLVSRSLFRHVNSCFVSPCVLSDHDFPSLKFDTF